MKNVTEHACQSVDEYTARAMLLGYRYYALYHSFIRKGEARGLSLVWYVDPDTLRPLDSLTAYDSERGFKRWEWGHKDD